MGREAHRACPCGKPDRRDRLALISKVLVMTGGPGVGKTTIVKAIRILAAKGEACYARQPAELPSA